MMNVRKSCILVSVTVASLLAVSSAAPTNAQAQLSTEVPLTVWEAQSLEPLDGYGGWLATGNDPTAGAGQATPAYSYFHEVYFANSESFADIALEVFDGRKSARLFVSDEESGRTHQVRVEFPWAAFRYYFLYLARLAPGIWGGYVHDATAGTWTEIGLVVLPTRLAKLHQESATGVDWIGPELESCSGFPLADVYRVKPLGFVGQAPIPVVATQRVNVPGDCPASVTAGMPTPDFDRYQVGVQGTGDAAPAARSESTRPDDARRYRG